MNELFGMGGYGFYVWGSYVVTFALLGVEVALLNRRARKIRG
jgi:heme exporter protein D